MISDLQPEFNAYATRATFRWNAVPDAPPGSSIAVAGTITLMRVGTSWYISDRVSDEDLENYRRIAKPSPDDEQADAPKVDDLPFPLVKGTVEFKKQSNRIEYESTADVDAVADAISDALAKAGWQTTGRDLGKQTRIMKRSRGEATLSYMIHPQSKGSRISIGTRGLDWSAK